MNNRGSTELSCTAEVTQFGVTHGLSRQADLGVSTSCKLRASTSSPVKGNNATCLDGKITNVEWGTVPGTLTACFRQTWLRLSAAYTRTKHTGQATQPKSQFPQVRNGFNDFLGFLWELSELLHGKCWAQSRLALIQQLEKPQMITHCPSWKNHTMEINAIILQRRVYSQEGTTTIFICKQCLDQCLLPKVTQHV